MSVIFRVFHRWHWNWSANTIYGHLWLSRSDIFHVFVCVCSNQLTVNLFKLQMVCIILFSFCIWPNPFYSVVREKISFDLFCSWNKQLVFVWVSFCSFSFFGLKQIFILFEMKYIKSWLAAARREKWVSIKFTLVIQYIIRIIYSGISRVYLAIYIFINDVFVCTNVCVCMTIVSRQSFCGFEKTTHLITLSAVNFLFFSFLKKKFHKHLWLWSRNRISFWGVSSYEHMRVLSTHLTHSEIQNDKRFGISTWH